MKILVFMNMPAGDSAGHSTHQVILDAPGVADLRELAFSLTNKKFLHGDHMIYERVGNAKVWKNRGPMIINLAHVGKIAPYYEGGKP